MISNITTQNTTFGAMRAKLEAAKELVSGTPFCTAHSAAERVKIAAMQKGDSYTANEADTFQKQIEESGIDSVFTEGESYVVNKFTHPFSKNHGSILGFVAETHEDAHTLPEEKITAAVLEKSSYTNRNDMIKVINNLLYGE